MTSRPQLAIAKTHSGNAKLGDCSTTHAAQASCPETCVFKDGGGCYAESGRQGMFVTRQLNGAAAETQATALDVAVAEAEAIDAMEVVAGRPMRLHTVGDCPTDECARIVAAAAARYVERGGGPVWTYTHAWRTVDVDSWRPVSVLASCETPEDVLEATFAGYATAIVVEQFASDKAFELAPDSPLHLKAVPCPAQTRHRACSDCRMCFDGYGPTGLHQRVTTIAFELHGIPYAIRQARQALRDPDDPERRIPSEERIRVVRDRYLRIEGREPTVREVSDLIDLNPASVGEWLRYLRGEIIHPAERRRRARKTLALGGRE